MITENLSTLKIHKLTKEQYERECEAGNLDANALYLTPDEEIDLSGYVTAEQLSTVIDDALTHAKESGEFDGADGTDGISATHSWSGTTLTITSASGTSSANLKGETGADGVGVSSVKQTTTSTADDGNNIITVTLTNGTTSSFTVQNGSKGSAGSKGDKGDSGYTPVRGTDYWTDADKAEIKSYVDEAILGGEW